MNKKFATSILINIVCVGIIINFIFSQTEPEKAPSILTENIKNHHNFSNNENHLTFLENEISILEGKLRAASKTRFITEVEVCPDVQLTACEDHREVIQETALNTLKVERFNQSMMEKMKDPNFDVTEEMVERYENEDIDFEWASGYEENIRETIIKSNKLNDLNLSDVSCRSKTCEIKIFADSSIESNEIAKLFTYSFFSPDIPTTSVISSYDQGAGELRLYLARHSGVQLFE